MTHTLHRQGDLQNEDYVWLMYQAKGVNDTDIAEKARTFLAAAEAVGCSNWGDVKSGSILLHPVDYVKSRISDQSRLRGVFNAVDQVTEFIKRVKAAGTGLSVVISGPLDYVLPACRAAGVTPHTINFSLGVWGKKELLPKAETLAVTTMCGHHMVAPGIVEKMARDVRSGKITPEEAGKKLASLCPCGIFNHIRAGKLVGKMAEAAKAAAQAARDDVDAAAAPTSCAGCAGYGDDSTDGGAGVE